MDKPARNFMTDIGSLLVILLVTVSAYWRYESPSILLAGGLAITLFVAADVVLLRRTETSSGH